MRRAALALLLVAPLAAQGSHWRAHDGWGLHSDKVLHVAAGALVGGTAYAISKGSGASPRMSAFIASLAALTVGILKERYDSHRGGWRDPADAAYTWAGGTGFAVTLYHAEPRKPETFATAPKLTEP